MLPCGAPQSKGGRNCLVERGLESFRMKKLVWVFMAAFFSGACASDFKLSSSFSNGGEFPIDNRGDEDNVSPPLKWSGVPKNTESFVLIVDSEPPASSKAKKRKVHWMVYDIPKDITEIREELSGAGSSDVARLGMKDDAGQAPVVVDPMGSIDGWVDPEVKAMQDMIHGALDASYDERNRAKEGATQPQSNLEKIVVYPTHAFDEVVSANHRALVRAVVLHRSRRSRAPRPLEALTTEGHPRAGPSSRSSCKPSTKHVIFCNGFGSFHKSLLFAFHLECSKSGERMTELISSSASTCPFLSFPHAIRVELASRAAARGEQGRCGRRPQGESARCRCTPGTFAWPCSSTRSRTPDVVPQALGRGLIYPVASSMLCRDYLLCLLPAPFQAKRRSQRMSADAHAARYHHEGHPKIRLASRIMLLNIWLVRVQLVPIVFYLH
eukprot:3072616-Pleurochrysis_carterae.AAC.3